ncbi:PREDICTED: 39S ribosomal protein L39, mitochondrial [Gekko japonicus]|uniref:39S ribosomal protein L39, mitochondrial n=1 Tax=Gekko japonicus TaxID=146911 RepID=A0ABM1L149_GEKJA|nr:PREDICTED: 39S ribosomal protein L39, mitochondrial [Gekko japonicus]
MASFRVARRLWWGCSRRFVSTDLVPKVSTAEIAQMRNKLFAKEKERQLSLYPRIEKIEVKYVGKSHPGTIFVMNKGLSTPYTCAMHLSEWHCKKSVLALVDGKIWEMYRPFTQSCEIQFLTFKDEDPEEVNKAYWRSCAMILGCVLEQAFKDEYLLPWFRYKVLVHAFSSLHTVTPTSLPRDLLIILVKSFYKDCLNVNLRERKELSQVPSE